jgi:hypothetical protein
LWCEYIAVERYVGDAEKARALYRRAAQANLTPTTASRTAWNDWIAFEREVGTLDQWQAAVSQCKTRFVVLDWICGFLFLYFIFREADWNLKMEKEAQETQFIDQHKAIKRKEHDTERLLKV